VEEQAANEMDDTVTAVEPTDDDEVQGHSMAISANFSIDITGVAATDKLAQQVRVASTPPPPVPPVR
jgi:hypothetical protein